MKTYVDAGSLLGYRVVVQPLLRETDIYQFGDKGVIICGRLSHLKYVLARAQLVLDLRADLERKLDAFATRVGVDRSTISE